MFTGYRTATYTDAEYVALNLREEDRIEVVAQTGDDPFTAVMDSYRFSKSRKAIVWNDEVVGVCGCGEEVYRRFAVPWMLVTDQFDNAVSAERRLFLEGSRELISIWERDFNPLPMSNEVHAEKRQGPEVVEVDRVRNG